MAVKVGLNGTVTRVNKVVTGQTTLVKKVVLGTPVRRIAHVVGNTIGTLADTNVDNLENGSMLVYDTSTSTWTATKDIDDGQNINGGSY